jgi:hypothetical protein
MEDQYNENDNAERRRRISLDDSNYDNKIIHISGAFLFVTLNGVLNGKLSPSVLVLILWGLWVLSIGFTMLSFKVSSSMNSADEIGKSNTADFYEKITKALTWLYSITFYSSIVLAAILLWKGGILNVK